MKGGYFKENKMKKERDARHGEAEARPRKIRLTGMLDPCQERHTFYFTEEEDGIQ